MLTLADNPMHADEEFGKRAGFKGSILHGLGTWNIAAHGVLQQLGNSDPSRFRAYGARFKSVVYPGETLETRMWITGSEGDCDNIVFETVVLEDGRVALCVSIHATAHLYTLLTLIGQMAMRRSKKQAASYSSTKWTNMGHQIVPRQSSMRHTMIRRSLVSIWRGQIGCGVGIRPYHCNRPRRSWLEMTVSTDTTVLPNPE